MRKLFLLLGILFMGVGYALINAIQEPDPEDLPKLHEQTGVISKVDIYTTSKFGEVCYLELVGIETRFWLKARLEEKPEEKAQLVESIKVGDQVTVHYTSLAGTTYAYASAPYSVRHLVSGSQTIDGLSFVKGAGNSTFLVVVFYGIGGLVGLVGVLFFGLFLWSIKS